MSEQVIKDRYIKLSGKTTCPLALSPERRYTIAVEVGIKSIEREPNHDAEQSWTETIKIEPIGEAVISNPEGKRAQIKVVSSPSQQFRFHLQTLYEQKGLESKVDFQRWYEDIYRKLYMWLDKIIDGKL